MSKNKILILVIFLPLIIFFLPFFGFFNVTDYYSLKEIHSNKYRNNDFRELTKYKVSNNVLKRYLDYSYSVTVNCAKEENIEFNKVDLIIYFDEIIFTPENLRNGSVTDRFRGLITPIINLDKSKLLNKDITLIRFGQDKSELFENISYKNCEVKSKKSSKLINTNNQFSYLIYLFIVIVFIKVYLVLLTLIKNNN